jgi:hypothetical protein
MQHPHGPRSFSVHRDLRTAFRPSPEPVAVPSARRSTWLPKSPSIVRPRLTRSPEPAPEVEVRELPLRQAVPTAPVTIAEMGANHPVATAAMAPVAIAPILVIG